MSKVVYWTTDIKPGDDDVVLAGLRFLLKWIPREEIIGATYLDEVPRADDAGWRGAAFQLTDKGIDIFRDGYTETPAGFRIWPDSVPEPTGFRLLDEIAPGKPWPDQD